MKAREAAKAAVASCAALIVALSGCGGGSPKRSSAATVASVAAPSGDTSARHRPALPPALARLERTLGRSLERAGPASGAAVVDLTTGRPLYGLRAGVSRPPASVEKLYTTVALLSLIGPDARLHTTVVGTGRLAPDGVWHGNLYLRGGGDPTLGDGTFNRVWERGYGPTALQLADQLAARGIRRVAGRIIGDETLFDGRRGGPATAYAVDVPDFGGQLGALTFDHGATTGRLSPGAFAARQLALTLRAIRIKALAAPRTGRAPARAQRLARVSSPPIATLVQLMNVPSDDLFAEMLTKQLGVRFGRGGTITAGAAIIRNVIGGYGLHPRISDGSGLSRRDGSSPSEIVALLEAVWRTPIGHVLSASLPVVGVGGTVRGIGIHTAARGNCIAKTGTLNDVTNLAGYCHTRSGDMTAFALLLDGPPNDQAIRLITRMVAAIAQY